MNNNNCIERRRHLKQFNKYFKKAKKEMVKHAKEFRCWDYGFIESILFDCIKMFYQFYKDPFNLYQDTESPINKYNEMVESLKRCTEIIYKLEECLYDTFEEEKSLRDELYNLIRVYHSAWWD